MVKPGRGADQTRLINRDQVDNPDVCVGGPYISCPIGKSCRFQIILHVFQAYWPRSGQITRQKDHFSRDFDSVVIYNWVYVNF